MDGTCCSRYDAGEGSFQRGDRTTTDMGVGEDLVEVRWSAEVEVGGVLRKLCVVGV